MRVLLTLLLALPLISSAKEMIPTPPDDLPVGALEPYLSAKFESLNNPDAKLADFAAESGIVIESDAPAADVPATEDEKTM